MSDHVFPVPTRKLMVFQVNHTETRFKCLDGHKGGLSEDGLFGVSSYPTSSVLLRTLKESHFDSHHNPLVHTSLSTLRLFVRSKEVVGP